VRHGAPCGATRSKTARANRLEHGACTIHSTRDTLSYYCSIHIQSHQRVYMCVAGCACTYMYTCVCVREMCVCVRCVQPRRSFIVTLFPSIIPSVSNFIPRLSAPAEASEPRRRRASGPWPRAWQKLQQSIRWASLNSTKKSYWQMRWTF